MPLPPAMTPWPPKQLAPILQHMAGWDAWYAGDTERLMLHYGAAGPNLVAANLDHMSTYRGGMVGRVARWFWGQPQRSLQSNKLHMPIASDICQAGADLLFAEPATFTVDDQATQDRLGELSDDTLHGVLAEAAEIGGALGGVYLRVTWDRNVVADQPFLTAVHADGAWPEFRWGRLAAVTFWRVVARGKDDVFRHVERHELANGEGVILHGLYQGDDGNLGRLVPLTETPDTAALAGLVDEDGTISTESPGLAVVYVPNQRPQRRWRNDPVGCSLGRSDLDGVEHLMDALDETYTSWMRDIRLGKARVFLARSMLDQLANGEGTAWDSDQEVYAPLNLLQSRDATGNGLPIQAEQFAIRYAEHQATAQDLVESILRTSGYSSQTFGMDSTGGRASNLTATEVQARERRSYLTRDRKIRLWRPAVTAVVEKLLYVDQAIFRSGVTPQAPSVAFADSVQESVITLAQTAQALAAARAASTQTLVQIVHPDWADDDVQAEVQRIHAEEAAATQVPDPTQLTAAERYSGFGA